MIRRTVVSSPVTDHYKSWRPCADKFRPKTRADADQGNMIGGRWKVVHDHLIKECLCEEQTSEFETYFQGF